MFNLFFRPSVPGFRVKAQQDVPGFNIGENDGPPLEAGTRPYLDEAQTQTPPIVTSFTLGSDGLTQSAPPIGFAGIRDDVPGFNLNESGVSPQRVPWFDGMRQGSAPSEYPDTLEPEPLPRDAGEPVQVTTPQLPEWLVALLGMPRPRLSSAVDPRTSQRIVPYAPPIRPLSAYQPTNQSVRAMEGRPVGDASTLPDSGSVETPNDEVWPTRDMLGQWSDFDARTGITTAQNSNPPLSQEAAWNAWLQPLKESQPSTQLGRDQGTVPSGAGTVRPPMSVPPTLSLSPARDSNFVLAKAADADVPSVKQQRLVPRDQETQREDQASPPSIMPGYADESDFNNALARMQLPANTRMASVPNIRGTVIASFADGGTLDWMPYPAYGPSAELGTPVGHLGRRIDAKPGNLRFRNNPPRLVDLRGPEGHEGTRPSMSDAYPEPLIPGAQYAQVVIQQNGAVTGNARIDRTTERLLSVLADTIQSLGPGAGPIFGIRAHVEFGRRVEELNIPGIRDKGVEQSFSLGRAARYGLEGSVRTDVVLRDREGIPIAVYDLKTGNARLTPARVREIRDELGRPNIPVIELRYREESSILR
ncbi:MAG TPA: hypothetical protein VK681_01745 [Reyranella sp.]|nr:hypothetical protein [Reyranella sp.]